MAAILESLCSTCKTECHFCSLLGGEILVIPPTLVGSPQCYTPDALEGLTFMSRFSGDLGNCSGRREVEKIHVMSWMELQTQSLVMCKMKYTMKEELFPF